MKRWSSAFLVLLVAALLIYNMIEAGLDFFSLFGGIVVVLFVSVPWIIVSFKKGGSQITILICVVIIFGSGASAVNKLFDVATPLATVEIDNSTKLYPMPEDPNPAQQETLDWFRGKTEITWAEFFEVSVFGNMIGASSIWISMILGWIILNMPLPEKIKKITIPLEVIIFFVTLASMIHVIYSPITSLQIDDATQKGLNIVWWLGFSQDWWMPLVFTFLGNGINWVNEKLGEASEDAELSEKVTKAYAVIGSLFSVATMFMLMILSATTNPTSVAWKVCSDVINDTAATNSICFQANQAGIVTMLYASMVWGWIVTSIKQFLGIR